MYIFIYIYRCQNRSKINRNVVKKLENMILSKPPKSKIHVKTYRFFNILQNHKK